MLQKSRKSIFKREINFYILRWEYFRQSVSRCRCRRLVFNQRRESSVSAAAWSPTSGENLLGL